MPGRFLAIYWPWERSRTKSRIDFDRAEHNFLNSHAIVTNEGNDTGIPERIHFPQDKSLPSSIDREKLKISSNFEISKRNRFVEIKKHSKSSIIDHRKFEYHNSSPTFRNSNWLFRSRFNLRYQCKIIFSNYLSFNLNNIHRLDRCVLLLEKCILFLEF